MLLRGGRACACNPERKYAHPTEGEGQQALVWVGSGISKRRKDNRVVKGRQDRQGLALMEIGAWLGRNVCSYAKGGFKQEVWTSFAKL